MGDTDEDSLTDEQVFLHTITLSEGFLIAA